MATGHILPGYGNPVTRLKRAKSAYPMDSRKLEELTAREVPGLDRKTLDTIRQNARNTWLSPHNEPTTYNSYHHYLRLDEPTQPRPTSPSRFHKPHPKNVFLTNRLHYIQGYHNPDATMGKEVYRVDDTFQEEERQLRRHQREKYVASPTTAAVDQFKEHPYAALTEACGPVEAWGAQAWLKTADDDKKHEVMNAIQDYREKELFSIPKDVPNYRQLQNISRQFFRHSPNVQTIPQYHNALVLPSNHATDVNVSARKVKTINEVIETNTDAQKPEEAEKTMLTEDHKANVAKTTEKKNEDKDKPKLNEKIKGTENVLNEKKSDVGHNSKQKVRIQSGHRAKSVCGDNKNALKTQPTKSCLKEKMFRCASSMTDRKSVTNQITQTADQDIPLHVQSPVPPQLTSPRPHTSVPSMQRWMKMSGAAESEQVRRILYGGYPPSTIQPLGNLGNPETTYKRRQQDIDTVKKNRYIHRPNRGDFLIHPEWPPTFPHHRID